MISNVGGDKVGQIVYCRLVYDKARVERRLTFGTDNAGTLEIEYKIFESLSTNRTFRVFEKHIKYSSAT